MKREAGELYLLSHLHKQHKGDKWNHHHIMCFLTGNNQLGQLPISSQLTEAQVNVFSMSGTTQSDTISREHPNQPRKCIPVLTGDSQNDNDILTTPDEVGGSQYKVPDWPSSAITSQQGLRRLSPNLYNVTITLYRGNPTSNQLPNVRAFLPTSSYWPVAPTPPSEAGTTDSSGRICRLQGASTTTQYQSPILVAQAPSPLDKHSAMDLWAFQYSYGLLGAKGKTASFTHNIHLPNSAGTTTGSIPTQKANTGLQHMVPMLCYLRGSYGNSPTTSHSGTDGIPDWDHQMCKEVQMAILGIYDINFRQDAAANPTRSWAFVYPSMYTQCFTDMGKDATDEWCKSCQSLDHTTNSCPVIPPPPKTPRRERINIEAKWDSICMSEL